MPMQDNEQNLSKADLYSKNSAPQGTKSVAHWRGRLKYLPSLILLLGLLYFHFGYAKIENGFTYNWSPSRRTISATLFYGQPKVYWTKSAGSNISLKNAWIEANDIRIKFTNWNIAFGRAETLQTLKFDPMAFLINANTMLSEFVIIVVLLVGTYRRRVSVRGLIAIVSCVAIWFAMVFRL